ncbi:Flp family type IVb pilin [Sphingomonas sp. GCM10030256]|uniref:Flp family type IVb pilin n=1 Tax=Sphingomonas sp. GCM10030256 TaxID=3273427 RepID=UPI00360F6E20
MNTFITMLKDESGAAAAEYALILAIVGAGLASAALFLGGKIKTSMMDTGNKIETCSQSPNSSGC